MCQEQDDSIAQPAAPNPDAVLHADDGEPSDQDSVFDGSSTGTGSTSLASSVLNYKYENGRRYHAFREGEYMLPNDDREQDRMDLHHHVFKLTLDGGLFRAPISKNPQRVLDLGTGTGIWAIEFADEFPSAVVIGNDLSPIQPSWVPPNCKFIVDDIEATWLYPPSEDFDLIHGRGMGGSVKDFDRLYAQAFKHIKPGGWIEVQDYETWVKSDDDPELKNCSRTPEWQKVVNDASIVYGKKFNIAEEQKERLLKAGFVDVQDDIYKVPIGPWPKDPKMKNLGRYQLEQMVDAVEPFTLALLTRVMGWTNEDTQLLMAGVRKDFRDWKKTHLYIAFHFVYGRKPEN